MSNDMNASIVSDLIELASQIEKMAEMLQIEGYDVWSKKLFADAQTLRGGDPVGCATYLGHFGGNGSLNDIQVSSPENDAQFEALCNSSAAIARRNYPSLLQQMGWHKVRPIAKTLIYGVFILLVIFIATNQ